MPNRILKESICTSDSIDSLSWFEEVLFYRLIVNCDDYGRFDGRVPVVKNRLFPLKENITAQSVKKAIDKLATVGLVTLYEFEGKPYLQLPTWEHHQVVRAKKSKYPPFDTDLHANEINCNQLQANVSVIQSNPNTEHNNNALSLSACARVEPTIVDVARYFEKSCMKKTEALREAEKFIEFNASRSWDCLKKGTWEQTAENWLARKEEREEAV